jgi:hypothetical protein
VQCNVFDGFSGEVALTAGGGRRGLPLLKDTYEDVALVNFPTVNNDEHILQFKILHVLISMIVEWQLIAGVKCNNLGNL